MAIECSGRIIMIIIVVILKLLNIFASILVFASNVVVIDAVRKQNKDEGDKFWYAIVRIYTILFCFLLILGEVPNKGPAPLRYIISYLKFFRSYLVKGALLFYIGVLTRDATFMAEMQNVADQNKAQMGDNYKFSGDAIKGFGYTVMAIGGVHVLFSVFHKLLMQKAGVEGSVKDLDPTRNPGEHTAKPDDVAIAVGDN